MADDEVATALVARPASGKDGDARFTLSVVEGRDSGTSFDLSSAAEWPINLGQSEACSFRLHDPEVSRRHVSLMPRGRHLVLRDLGSTNGTFVDGVAIGEAFLRGGEIVRVGSTALRVDREIGVSLPEPLEADGFGRLLGQSPEMRRLYGLARRLADTTIPVVIEGETGTGKEALAESIHELGPRAGGPFVVFDCTAIAPNLIESELFGHDRGAFTGASVVHQGYFEQADGGTLLIDEIGDLETHLQSKLLRAIERSEVRRVGGSKPIHVDVRILAATRRDLDHEVQAGRFRDDLFHRLAVARIEMPPLRRRRGDVEALAKHFWTQAGGRPEDLRQSLLSRWEEERWPGNVRELRNRVARTVALGESVDDGEPLLRLQAEPSDLAERMKAIVAEGAPYQPSKMKLVREFERIYVASALARHGGNVTAAAAASGLARRYFQVLKAGGRR